MPSEVSERLLIVIIHGEGEEVGNGGQPGGLVPQGARSLEENRERWRRCLSGSSR